MADRADLDLFEEFCRVARDNGLARATLGDMSVEFAPEPAPVAHFDMPPMPVDAPASTEPVEPPRSASSRLFGKRPVPTFRIPTGP